jgi:hypothetical protein
MILERFKLQKNLKLALTSSNLDVRIISIIKKAIMIMKQKVKHRKLAEIKEETESNKSIHPILIPLKTYKFNTDKSPTVKDKSPKVNDKSPAIRGS